MGASLKLLFILNVYLIKTLCDYKFITYETKTNNLFELVVNKDTSQFINVFNLKTKLSYT